MKVLKLLMFNNYISFEGKIYRQLQGTAKGTAVAPAFAKLTSTSSTRTSLDNDKIQVQLRFIDDGFMVVDSKEKADKIMRNMKRAMQPFITHDISETSAIFLDLEVYKGQRHTQHNMLDLRPYFKPTNRFLYLFANSNHPKHMKLSIVKGEAIRCLRNSTDKVAWLSALRKIFQGLIARGYDGRDIKRKWKQVRCEQRRDYLFGENVDSTKPEGTLTLTRYHTDTNKT